jgi:chromosome segregation ATPase
MNLGGQVQNIESNRDEQLKGMREQESAVRKQIRERRDAEIENEERRFDLEKMQLQNQIDAITAQISDMKKAIAELPPGSKQRKQLEKQINSLKKQRAELKAQLTSKRLRKNSKVRSIQFKYNMKEKNKMINFSRKKSMLLRDFAGQVMQARQRETQMKRQQQSQSTSVSGSIKPPGGSSSGNGLFLSPESRGPGGA